MPNLIDLSGKTFGRLFVIRRDGSSNDRQARWACVCECGEARSINGGALRSGHTVSCGCYNREQLKTLPITHGMSYTPTFSVWRGMLARCTNKNLPEYKNYGGRGVTVCDKWKNFEAFLADMGEKPDGLSIDRIDNDKGYSAENCRWASREEQNKNKRSNIWLEVDGVRMIAKDWARKLGTGQQTITNRIARGWSVKDACLTPPRPVLWKGVEMNNGNRSASQHIRYMREGAHK